MLNSSKTNLNSGIILIRGVSGLQAPSANRMRSLAFIRNVIVLCVYSIYQSIDEYPLYCEIGIAIAVTLIQVIIDNIPFDGNFIGIFNANLDQDVDQFATNPAR